jgi:hypothetical protein
MNGPVRRPRTPRAGPGRRRGTRGAPLGEVEAPPGGVEQLHAGGVVHRNSVSPPTGRGHREARLIPCKTARGRLGRRVADTELAIVYQVAAIRSVFGKSSPLNSSGRLRPLATA